MLSKSLTPAQVQAAEPFIKALIEHYMKVYTPSTLFNENPNVMTKQVATFDLINRQINELENLLRPKENIQNDPISSLQRKYSATKFRAK